MRYEILGIEDDAPVDGCNHLSIGNSQDCVFVVTLKKFSLFCWFLTFEVCCLENRKINTEYIF